MNTSLSRLGPALAGLGLVAVLAVGCSSPAATVGQTTSPVPTSAPGSAASASAGPSSAAAATQASGAAKVNANIATESELAAAFGAAGIPNADRWAREVAEYRPYDSDPTWAKLRQELAKYNIDPTVLEQIIATLEP